MKALVILHLYLFCFVFGFTSCAALNQPLDKTRTADIAGEVKSGAEEVEAKADSDEGVTTGDVIGVGIGVIVGSLFGPAAGRLAGGLVKTGIGALSSGTANKKK